MSIIHAAESGVNDDGEASPRNEAPCINSAAAAVEPAAVEPAAVVLRGREQPAKNGRRISGPTPEAAIQQALSVCDYPAPEPLIELCDTKAAAFLDVDCHKIRFSDADRTAILHALQPAPRVQWPTHGGGIRGVYFASALFAADELAALAAMKLQREAAVPFSGIEIKRSTRHPLYPRGGERAGPVCWNAADPFLLQSVKRAVFSALRFSADEDDVFDEEERDELLIQMGLFGKPRHPHECCPFDPSPSHGDPVAILDRKIYCHKCRRSAPFAQLIGKQSGPANPLFAAARYFAHFAQVDLMLSHYAGWLNWHPAMRRTAWRAVLKSVHLTHANADYPITAYQEMIDRVFYEMPILRGDGEWVHLNEPNKGLANDGKAKLVGMLPMTRRVSAKGIIEAHPKRSAIALNNGNLTQYGYPTVAVINEIDLRHTIGGEWDDPDTFPALLQKCTSPFRYRPAERRSRHWEGLELCFPGVNRSLVKLLIGALGFAQGNPHEPPRIAIHGQSGAGKTAHVALAAMLARSRVGDVRLSNDPDKVRRAYADACPGLAVIDEYGKVASDAAALTELIIMLRRGSSFHRLYRGVGRLPGTGVVVLTDTAIPALFQHETQLARRIVGVSLGGGIGAGKIDWRVTAGEIATALERLQLHDAADSIVSEVMDELKSSPTFERYAESLGFLTLDKPSDGIDPDAPFVELFREAIRCTPLKDSTFSGRGWCVFKPFDSSPIAAAWRACGGSDTERSAQPIKGKQWARLLDIDGVELGTYFPKGARIGLRFLVGDARSPKLRVGSEIIPVDHPRFSDLLRPQSGTDASILPLSRSGGNGGNVTGSLREGSRECETCSDKGVAS